MKYFQWTIGSTTVRNPDRLKDGLQILNDHFDGQQKAKRKLLISFLKFTLK